VLNDAKREPIGFRRGQKLKIRDDRRLALAHIGPDRATFFLYRIGRVTDLMAEFPVFGFGRLIDTFAVNVEKPSVIKTA
jgi:hypothetical protein